MKNTALYILLSLTLNSVSQNKLLIKEIEENKVFRFPIIKCLDSIVSKKINYYLQISELGLLIEKKQKTPFENLSFLYQNGRLNCFENMNYIIINNTANCLSLSLNIGNRNVCPNQISYYNYYNFNPKTGDRYFLKDFFSKEHFEEFQKIVTQKRIDNFHKHNLKNSGERISCDRYFDSIRKDYLNNFYIIKDSIYFDDKYLNSFCSRDFAFNLTTSISIKSIKPLLNEYGLSALVTGKQLNKYSSEPLYQVLEGSTENGDKFHFIISKTGYRNEYGCKTEIAPSNFTYIYGFLNENNLTLSERDLNNNIISNIQINISTTPLSGIWTKENQNIKFNLIRK